MTASKNSNLFILRSYIFKNVWIYFCFQRACKDLFKLRVDDGAESYVSNFKNEYTHFLYKSQTEFLTVSFASNRTLLNHPTHNMFKGFKIYMQSAQHFFFAFAYMYCFSQTPEMFSSACSNRRRTSHNYNATDTIFTFCESNNDQHHDYHYYCKKDSANDTETQNRSWFACDTFSFSNIAVIDDMMGDIAINEKVMRVHCTVSAFAPWRWESWLVPTTTLLSSPRSLSTRRVTVANTGDYIVISRQTKEQ